MQLTVRKQLQCLITNTQIDRLSVNYGKILYLHKIGKTLQDRLTAGVLPSHIQRLVRSYQTGQGPSQT